VVTKSRTIWNLYLNGVLDAATVTDGTSITSSGPFYVGAYIYAATQLLDGNIDEVQISNIARSADWVKTEYNKYDRLLDVDVGHKVRPEDTPLSFTKAKPQYH
jgi:hypothetical protein